MAKTLILVAVCFLVQVSYVDMSEFYNDFICSQLILCEKAQKEPGSAIYVDDLKKLANIFQECLKANSSDKQLQVLSAIQYKFSSQFNSWFLQKRIADSFNYEIQVAIQFYQSLLSKNSKHEAEIKSTVITLENLLKETDLEEKNKHFSALEETFSVDFKIKLNQATVALEYIDKLLKHVLSQKDVKFAKEILELKEKTGAALANNVSSAEKTKVLCDINYIGNEELRKYLQIKNNEFKQLSTQI